MSVIQKKRTVGRTFNKGRKETELHFGSAVEGNVETFVRTHLFIFFKKRSVKGKGE